jgi:hypothetical protein
MEHLFAVGSAGRVDEPCSNPGKRVKVSLPSCHQHSGRAIFSAVSRIRPQSGWHHAGSGAAVLASGFYDPVQLQGDAPDRSHNVAPSLPNDLIAQVFQDPDHLTPRYDRQLGAHTVTATLLIKVLDISGMGWC